MSCRSTTVSKRSICIHRIGYMVLVLHLIFLKTDYVRMDILFRRLDYRNRIDFWLFGIRCRTESISILVRHPSLSMTKALHAVQQGPGAVWDWRQSTEKNVSEREKWRTMEIKTKACNVVVDILAQIGQLQSYQLRIITPTLERLAWNVLWMKTGNVVRC